MSAKHGLHRASSDFRSNAIRGTGSSGVSGIQTVVLKGDPNETGVYTIMLRVPAHTQIAAHSHRYVQLLYGIRTKSRWYGAAYALVRPLYPLLKMLFPNYVTTTECVGRAMLIVTKRGFPKPVLENRDINVMCAKDSK